MPDKPLRIFIDENLPFQYAVALNVIQEHLNVGEKKKIIVLSIPQVFGFSTKDEEWIPLVGNENGIVVTYDRRIQHSRHQKQLYQHHGAGMIFLKSSKEGVGFWQGFKNLIDVWDDITQIAKKNAAPFAYRQIGFNKGFEKWDHQA